MSHFTFFIPIDLKLKIRRNSDKNPFQTIWTHDIDLDFEFTLTEWQ